MLIVGLLLAGLLTAVALGFSTLVRVEVEAARQMRLRIEAQEAARLALYMGIGELQSAAGADQRITACAGLLGDAVALRARRWVGVWKVTKPEEAPKWLVSGKEPNPLALAAAVVELLPGFHSDTEGLEDKRFNLPAAAVPLRELEGSGRVAYAWWVSDDGAKAALRPVRGILAESLEPEARGYLDYNENSLHAARFRQDPAFDFPQLYDLSESERLGKIEGAQSTNQLAILSRDLSGEARARIRSEFAHTVCLENRFVLSNPLDGGLKKDLSYVKTLLPEDRSDETLQRLYEDPDDLLREAAARLIQHRGNPSAKRRTRSNAKMLLTADSAETAAERLQYFSLAPVVTELQLVLALAATPLRNGEGEASGASDQLHLAHRLTLELWNPYTVPFLLGEAGGGGQTGHSDLRLVIRNLPSYHLTKRSDGGTAASGTLPEINLLWSRDSGIARYRKLLRPGMVFRKSIPAATARREVRTMPLEEIAVTADDPLRGTFVFRGNRPVEIELYGIDGNGDEKSFFKAKIEGYDGFTTEYSPANGRTARRLLFTSPLKGSLLEDNPNAFAIGFRLLDKQSPGDVSEHYSRLLSHYEVRRPILEIDLDELDPDDPWASDPPLPYDCRVDGQSHDPGKYRPGRSFAPSDIFHHNENSSLGGRKDRVARAFDWPIGEVMDVGIFRVLQFRDYPANAVGNPWGGPLNRLYDRYFFSTLPDPDTAEWEGSRPLANARIRGHGETPQLENPNTANQLLLYNGFNLNAASPLVWEKVLLGGNFAAGELRLKTEEPNGKPEWQVWEAPVRRAYANFPQTTLFNQSEYASGDGYRFTARSATRQYREAFSTHKKELASDRQHPALRQSLCELTPTEVTALADAVVDALRHFVRENERPPLSLAEYLNAGILEQAIDATPSINQRIDGYDGIPRHSAASITQATLMNALGPLAFVRSDSFTIRAFARVRDPEDPAGASAICEAQLQRIPEPLPEDFGRRFIILNFHWLSPSVARL